MDFNVVMTKIRDGLTGDPMQDIPYLQGAAQSLPDKKLASSVGRECGRMIFAMLPAENCLEVEKMLEENYTSRRQDLNAIHSLMRTADTSAALDRAADLSAHISSLYDADDVVEFHDFQSTFEEMLFYKKCEPSREVRHTSGLEAFEIELTYGSLLAGSERLDAAAAVLSSALEWNPVSCDGLFAMADLYRKCDKQAFLSWNRKAYEAAYTPEMLLRFYENLRWYYLSEQMWQAAKVCTKFMMEQNPEDESILSLLHEVDVQAGHFVCMVPYDQLASFCSEHKIPMGAHAEVSMVALESARTAYEQQDVVQTAYFLKIYHSLTGDAGAGRMLQEINTSCGGHLWKHTEH